MFWFTRHRSCPLCKAKLRQFICLEGRDTTICTGCRHISWSQLPSATDLAEYYAARYGADHSQESLQESQREFYRGHARELHQYARSVGPLSLIDFGCSYPTFIIEAARTGLFASVRGVDHDRDAIAAAKEHGLEILAPDRFLADVPPHSVDILRFAHVIEHMIAPEIDVPAAIAKVKTGGLIYITQPTFPVLRLDAQPATLKDAVYPEHLHFFTPLSLSRLMALSGCEVIKFAAFHNEAKVEDTFADQWDSERSRSAVNLIGLTTPNFDARGGYPRFFGENCELIAIKK